MKLELPFQNTIPKKYTKYGDNVSPSLNFSDLPDGTETVAVIVDDPDAKPVAGMIWDHWLIWNIPRNDGIPENATDSQIESIGAVQGANDFGNNQYGGPKPPSGTHSYRFRAYALNKELDLAEGATKEELIKAMEGHVLDSVTVEADYE